MTILRCLMVLLVLGTAPPALAAPNAKDWDGTWVGNWDNKGDGVQIIMAGNTITGFFFHGDYMDTGAAGVSADGKVLKFSWRSGSAVLNRTGLSSAHAIIHEKGKPDLSFDVKPDS